MQERRDQTQQKQLLLKLEGICKQFPGVLALDNVDFDLREGEVHVLFGENGAGKSTLINIVAGSLRPTSGKLIYRDKETHFSSVHSARKIGISAVFQEFSLIPQLTVTQNLFLGVEKTRRGLLDQKTMNLQAKEILNKLGFQLHPAAKIMSLTRAEQQMVEIAKAFSSELSILILDEPTASLTERETERLFELINQAKSRGVGVIYITHRMGEINRISDRITVLRDGRYVTTLDTGTISDVDLVELMTGRVIDHIFPKIRYNPGETLLRVENLVTEDRSVRDASIEVKKGEIVGMAGLVGSGKSEIMRACFGIEGIRRGDIYFEGQRINKITPASMMKHGVFYVPPDRRIEGLLMMRAVRENISLSALDISRLSIGSFFLRTQKEKEMVQELATQMQLSPPKVERMVGHFSGGNQQKVMLAKVLTRETKLFIFDEPTVGVDVGTRAAIYEFIRDLCEAGAAIVLVSSDLPEILHLTNRAYVFYRGKIQAELQGDDITEKNVLLNFFEQDAA
ncbi:sugar ABC transporter ATP-binding protein [bacterium]|nr:sugar ABC transporter ATP-binding protein [bacterium]